MIYKNIGWTEKYRPKVMEDMKLKIIETKDEVKKHEDKVNEYLKVLTEDYNHEDINICHKITTVEFSIYYTTLITTH